MKNQIDQFIESAREVRLTGEAKLRIRERLVAHMQLHPVAPALIESPYQRFMYMFSPLSSMRMGMAALALILLVGLGGTATYAAQRSLPGDTLYPLKVGVIEPVKGLLATTPQAKAELQVSLAVTRANEVEQLAKEGRLTPEQSAQNQERLDGSLEEARASIGALAKEDPEASAKIEAALMVSLSAHQQALSAFATQASSTSAKEAQSFSDHLKVKSAATTTLDVLSKKPDSDTRDKHERDPEKPLPLPLDTSTSGSV